MVASRDTIERAAAVVRRRVGSEVGLALLLDLAAVPGNASFRQTVTRVADALLLSPDLPAGVARAAPGNEVRTQYYATDMDRISQWVGDPGLGREGAVVQAVLLAERHPGNTIHLMATAAAFRRPRDRGGVLALPLRGG